MLSEIDIKWYLAAKNQSCNGRQIDMGKQPTLLNCAEACLRCNECENLTMFTFGNNKTRCKTGGCQCFCQHDSGENDYLNGEKDCNRWREDSEDVDLYKYSSEGSL